MTYHRSGALAGTHASAARLQTATSELFGVCLDAFQAFAGLGELSEDMRVLSLNAELAAGRAGDRGAGVRVLTQYTRELVSRLNATEHDIDLLRSRTYRHSAAALRALNRLNILERALARLIGKQAKSQAGSLHHVQTSHAAELEGVMHNVAEMVGCVERLALEAAAVEEVTAQSGSIATNIAIEASTAGRHEAEFRQVASTMRTYIEQLKTMQETAGRLVRTASDGGRHLHELAIAGQQRRV